MVAAKIAIALGIVCFAAIASAQDSTIPFSDSLPAGASDDFSTGSYLVNGTGVVYDADTITFYANGTIIGTLPNPKAPGPDMDPHSHDDSDHSHDKSDHSTDKSDHSHDKSDDTKKPFELPAKKSKDPPTPSPEATEDMFEDIHSDDKSDDTKKPFELPAKKSKDPPTPSPEATEDMFEDILQKTKEQPNPLYSVVLGRRLMR